MGEVSIRVRGNDGRMSLPTLTISAGSGWLDQRERFSNNIAGKEQKNYTLLKKGQLSYNHGNSKLAKYGAVFELRTFEEALVPRVYHSFDVSKEADTSFVEYLFATKKPDRELRKLISSGARMDGLLNINYDDFMGIDITIPSKDEQSKIAGFLRELDQTITLHQRKLDALKQMKKGFLQVMFPENGESRPKLRFADFDEEWEQRKLKDVAPLQRGFDLPKDKINVGPYPVVFSNGTGAYHNEYKVLGPGIVTGRSGSIGNVFYIEDNYWPHNTSLWVTNFNGNFPLFIYYLFEKFDLSRFKSGSGVPTLNRNDAHDQLVCYPKDSEQTKVGTFFQQLDRTITLHQEKLDKLTKLKQTYLQKMFI